MASIDLLGPVNSRNDLMEAEYKFFERKRQVEQFKLKLKCKSNLTYTKQNWNNLTYTKLIQMFQNQF